MGINTLKAGLSSLPIHIVACYIDGSARLVLRGCTTRCFYTHNLRFSIERRAVHRHLVGCVAILHFVIDSINLSGGSAEPSRDILHSIMSARPVTWISFQVKEDSPRYALTSSTLPGSIRYATPQTRSSTFLSFRLSTSLYHSDASMTVTTLPG